MQGIHTMFYLSHLSIPNTLGQLLKRREIMDGYLKTKEPFTLENFATICTTIFSF